MENPLVSIIIPTFNRAHLLGETLDSIIAQTYDNWECIVVDDGSTDATEELLNTYIEKDQRFQFYKRPKNKPKGANACRNYGFKLSKGKFINWFDSDDLMQPNKLEVQLEALLKNTEAPYCICQTKWIDKTDNTFLGLRAKYLSSENRFEDYILFEIFWSILAPVWRRDFIIYNKLVFDETLHQSQEYDFHIKALAINSNYITITEPLVSMFKHNENLSNNILNNDLKICSNLKVKAMVFETYADRLSNAGKIKLYEILTLMFKDLLVLKNYKKAYQLLWQLIDKLKYLKIPWIKKAIFSLKLIVIFMSFRIFGKGYNLIKPLK